MLGIAAQQFRRSTSARPSLWRQRLFAGCPHASLWPDAGNVRQVESRNALAQLGADTVTSIHQHHAARQTGLNSPAHLFESDFWFGLEVDVLGHTGLAATFLVVCPLLRQVKLISNRQARMVVGERHRHRDLAVILLAELAAILARHAN